MPELPEEEIEEAEVTGSHDHVHVGLSSEDDSLLEHVRTVHKLDASDDLSPSTVEGLHDRMHDDTDAAND